MNLRKKIFILGIFLIFISICGVYSAFNPQTDDNSLVIDELGNETDVFGCCSIVWQLDGNDTIFSYRRDSNLNADIYIEQVNWHGHQAIKQYKTEGGYFNHVIITSDGWFIGLGGIDDGIDSEKCENITAKMINNDSSISKDDLKEIQSIKKPYGRGHVLIKAPNGNYGFATVDKIKTGKLEPGEYKSIPNNYSLSRGGELPLNSSDKIKSVVELSQADKYGQDRREIITYYFNSTDNGNFTDIYVSNEDGSLLGIDYSECIDNVYFNGTLTEAKDIPIGPDYKKIGDISFIEENSNFSKLIMLIVIVAFVIFVGILFFIVYRFVRFIKFKIRR